MSAVRDGSKSLSSQLRVWRVGQKNEVSVSAWRARYAHVDTNLERLVRGTFSRSFTFDFRSEIDETRSSENHTAFLLRGLGAPVRKRIERCCASLRNLSRLPTPILLRSLRGVARTVGWE